MRSRGLMIAVAMLCGVARPAVGASEDATRVIMHRVFESMQHLLPLAFTNGDLNDAQQAEAVKWSAVLVEATGSLQTHQTPRVQASRPLSRSLASDARTVAASFEQGEELKAQYYILALTDNCVACHSRLPKGRDAEFAKAFFEAGEPYALDPRSRTRLLVATRQFGAALDAWELQFADTARRPEDVDQNGSLDDYLTISIRVEDDPARAKRTLERFARRSTLPLYLRETVGIWIRSLDDLIAEPDRPATLAAAQALLARSEALQEYPNDRRGRIYDVAASGALHRLLAKPPAYFDTTVLAEALYLLGSIEARGPDGSWISEAEMHLERSIRLAPNAPFAVDAYNVLEEYTLTQYAGAGGVDIPSDRQQLLDELRSLVEPAPRPAAPRPDSSSAAES